MFFLSRYLVISALILGATVQFASAEIFRGPQDNHLTPLEIFIRPLNENGITDDPQQDLVADLSQILTLKTTPEEIDQVYYPFAAEGELPEKDLQHMLDLAPTTMPEPVSLAILGISLFSMAAVRNRN